MKQGLDSTHCSLRILARQLARKGTRQGIQQGQRGRHGNGPKGTDKGVGLIGRKANNGGIGAAQNAHVAVIRRAILALSAVARFGTRALSQIDILPIVAVSFVVVFFVERVVLVQVGRCGILLDKRRVAGGRVAIGSYNCRIQIADHFSKRLQSPMRLSKRIVLTGWQW
jgi:hypothetical protein